MMTAAAVIIAQPESAAAQQAKITYWWWGESDIPGIDKWMGGMVAAYEKQHPEMKISIVPQSTDTLIGAFRLAAQGHSGPDIDTQWATLPTLTPYWNKAAVAISDYVPGGETGQWINTAENVVDGKIVAIPIYLIGVPLVWNKELFKQAGLDPNKPPATWDEFLADCAALKSHGITPFGMGNKDGYFGAWMFAIYLTQELNSLDEIKSAIGNTGTFTMAQFDGLLRNLYSMMQDLVQKDYLNSDISSLDLNQGWTLFPQKKVAMSFTTDGNVLSWAKAIGAENVGVAMPPRWGHGKLSDVYDVTQSSDEFITSWSANKQADAAFLTYLHEPDNMKALYDQTGAFPADKRFPVSDITDPLAQRLYKLDTATTSVWLENYLPPQVDNDADLPAGQLITSKSGGPDEAVAIWNRVINKWRAQQVPEYQEFRKWASAGG
jgi:multiple sugar transport system substrate-binding protein